MTYGWISKLGAILAACLWWSTVSLAQGTFGPGFNPGFAMNMDVALSGSRSGTGGTICGRSYSNDNEKAELLRLEAQGQCSQDQRKSAKGDEVGKAPFSATYSLNKSRTSANLQSFADKTRATDPTQADKMEALFASTDIMGLMGDSMRSVGLSRNNAADAFAVYWVSAWQAANGRVETPSPATYQAVAAQAARGLSQSAEFAGANDAQKQEMAEALMLQAALIDGSIDDAGSDRAKQKAVAKAVLQGAKASGLDLDTMTLTNDGFVEGGPRKRADASEAVSGDDQRLASNNNSEGQGKTTNYALIAAAAGAGLGGVFLLGKIMERKG